MYLFLIPLLFGFVSNAASAFTATYSRRWGEKRGKLVSAFLRNVTGMPLWTVGYILAFRAALPLLFTPNPFTEISGWSLIALGALIILWSLPGLGRRAFAPSTQDTLVASGLHAYVRHPLYSGVLLEFAGLAILNPSYATVLACLLGMVWIYLQARFEELDLLQRIPAYREYMQRVPRFIPRLRKRRA